MSPLQQFLVSSFAAIAMAAPSQCPPRGLTVDAEVINVVDGDTIDCRVSYDIRVRLIDCWAPEVRTLDLEEKRKGLAAKRHMSALVESRRVRVHLPSTGSFADLVTFERVLGHIWRLTDGAPEGQSVSARMVRDGFATAERPLREDER